MKHHNVHQTKKVDLNHLWEIVQSLKSIWPSRLSINDTPLGDVWQCDCLKNQNETIHPLGKDYSHYVPFHKLSQWLTYSLCEPIEKLLNWSWEGKQELTGLAEYRNGGLLIDLGILKLNSTYFAKGMQNAINAGGSDVERVPLFFPEDQAIIEWRALTVALLDEIAGRVRQRLNVSETDLELAKVLEAGTWKVRLEAS
jgi:hypothetical protein